MTENVPRVGFFFFAGRRFGGAERRYARLAEHMQNRGLAKVTVFSRSDFLLSLKSMGITLGDCEIVECMSADGQHFGSRALSLLKCLRSIRNSHCDHVHLCLNPGLVSFMYSICSKFLPPHSISMNAGLFSRNAGAFAKSVFAPYSVAKAKSVDCLGPRYKEQLRQYTFSKDYEKLSVAPCSFTGEWSIQDSGCSRDIDITFAARFVEGKGIDLLESALRNENLCIHVCGSGPLDVNLPKANVYYTESLIDVLRRTKIFVSLQDVDNYPSQSVLEAMSAGCSIIATDVGDTRMFLNNENSVLISPDRESLRKAIFLLLKNTPLRRKLGAEASKALTQKHTIENYSEYFLSEVVRNAVG